jgi:hypothetical protein
MAGSPCEVLKVLKGYGGIPIDMDDVVIQAD